jgi:hypothetical protein
MALGRNKRLQGLFTACAATLLIGACGGGGGGGGELAPAPSGGPPPGPPSAPPGVTPTDAQRIAAATGTAQSNTNFCQSIRPFYWEMGDRAARMASGSVNAAGNAISYSANSLMNIASASKWLYGAYVAQKQTGALTASDIKFLTFRSGYTDFTWCLPTQNVEQCASYQNNGVLNPAHDGKFFYSGGHMQNHAKLFGLGALGNTALAAEMQAQLGVDIGLSYVLPQPAGGVATTAADYAVFLRKLMDGTLTLGSLLGSNKVCTNPTTCPAEAVETPVPSSETWHYSLGHWVEDDPNAGDGSFSSAGAFGFYPWIDADRTYYGIIARQGAAGGGYDSARCGRQLRKAWMTGTVQ